MSDLYLDNCRHTPNPRSSGNEYPKSIINLESRMWQLAVVSSSRCKSHLQGILRQFWLILHRCVDLCLVRAVFGASLLPFRGSVRSCNKMGLMSSLLTEGRQLPMCLLQPRNTIPKSWELMLCTWYRLTVTLSPRDSLFFKFAGLLGSRNPPLKDLWVDSKPCGCKVEAWCDCVGTGRVFWSSYCHKLSCPISKMICAIHCWLFLSIH